MRERLEPPPVTILFKTEAWRLGLRDGMFLVPTGGSWKNVPAGVQQAIDDNWDLLVQAWDAMYPDNPVEGTDDE